MPRAVPWRQGWLSIPFRDIMGCTLVVQVRQLSWSLVCLNDSRSVSLSWGRSWWVKERETGLPTPFPNMPQGHHPYSLADGWSLEGSVWQLPTSFQYFRVKSYWEYARSISQVLNCTVWELRWLPAYHVQKLRGGPQLLSQGLCTSSPPFWARQLVLEKDGVSHRVFTWAVTPLPTSSQLIGLDVQITTGRYSAVPVPKALVVEVKGSGIHEPRIPAYNIQRIKSSIGFVLCTLKTSQIVAPDIFFLKRTR